MSEKVSTQWENIFATHISEELYPKYKNNCHKSVRKN